MELWDVGAPRGWVQEHCPRPLPPGCAMIVLGHPLLHWVVAFGAVLWKATILRGSGCFSMCHMQGRTSATKHCAAASMLM